MTIKQKIIAGAVLAFAALSSGSALAYIPRDAGFELSSPFTAPFSLVPPSVEHNILPIPRIPSLFLRSENIPRFQVKTQIASAGPLGFQIFCLKNPVECKTSEISQIPYTAKLARKLSMVNINVNRTIVGRNDVGIDQWDVNVAEGDCEEYVLTKRSELVADGLPISALRIVTARTPQGVGHAVLVVRTDRGDLVLDNLNNTVKPWNQVNLELISVSGANPFQWFKLV